MRIPNDDLGRELPAGWLTLEEILAEGSQGGQLWEESDFGDEEIPGGEGPDGDTDGEESGEEAQEEARGPHTPMGRACAAGEGTISGVGDGPAVAMGDCAGAGVCAGAGRWRERGRSRAWALASTRGQWPEMHRLRNSSSGYVREGAAPASAAEVLRARVRRAGLAETKALEVLRETGLTRGESWPGVTEREAAAVLACWGVFVRVCVGVSERGE